MQRSDAGFMVEARLLVKLEWLQS